MTLLAELPLTGMQIFIVGVVLVLAIMAKHT